METKNLHIHIRNLATLEESSSAVASCYFDLQNGVAKCTEFLMGRKRLLERNLGHRARQDLHQAVSEVHASLRTKADTNTKGMAIFTRTGTSPFLLPLQFRVPLPYQLVFARSP